MLIAAPTTIMLIEKSYDVSVFFSINEEENTHEVTKKVHVNLVENSFLDKFFELKKKTQYGSLPENYLNLALENNSPPPEFL